MNGRAFLYMGSLVRSSFAFGTHDDISPLGCGSPFFSLAMSLRKSFILLLNFMLAVSSGIPCICQVVISLSCILLSLLSFTLDSLTFNISHLARACLMSSQAEPFYISFVAWFPIFYQEGTFPRVSLSCTCFLALSIGMFHFLELVFLPMTLISS